MAEFDRPLEGPLVERLLLRAIITINDKVFTEAQAMLAVNALPFRRWDNHRHRNRRKFVFSDRAGQPQLFRLSVNRTFGSFVINHHERRKVHAKEASQLHTRRESLHFETPLGRTCSGIRSV
jgi:hypothetical protein